MSLLSAVQMQSIQKLGLQGMTTTVEILPTTYDSGLDLTDSAYGSELTYATAPSVTVKGWLVTGPWASVRDAGAIADVNSTTQYRLRLPVGTEIEPGWRVNILDNEYMVEDAGTDQTWPEWLNCTLKRNK